jgi:hypothetical protein
MIVGDLGKKKGKADALFEAQGKEALSAAEGRGDEQGGQPEMAVPL